MKWIKKHLIDLILVTTLLVGLGLLLYPTVSDTWNKYHQSHAIANYAEQVANIDDSHYREMLLGAVEYNRKLDKNTFVVPDEADKKIYEETLDITGSGIMGYIEIQKIKCSLPIYHGTSDAVLQSAIGHIEGTSLPVGGESTHCVLSGHRGLPSAKLFTDLDKMEKGDKFVIRVLDETLTYEVDQILIVEPQDVSPLSIIEGEDYCTLVTCTPYGVNSHRLLVRGHRVENETESFTIRVTADAIQIDTVIVAPFVAIPILIILILMVAFGGGKMKD